MTRARARVSESPRTLEPLEHSEAHREEQCAIRFVTGGFQSTKYLVPMRGRVHVSTGMNEIFQGVEVDMKD